MHPPIPSEFQAKLAKVKLFLCDVDGILTDSSIYIGQESETKRFHIRDGLGMVMLREHGIKVGWVSARVSPATTLRAQELKIDFLEQTKLGKVAAVEAILARTGFTWEEVSYMGDDVVDLGVLRRAGVAVTVADAIAEAKEDAYYITTANGGHGAVRELVELILRAQGFWDGILARHRA